MTSTRNPTCRSLGHAGVTSEQLDAFVEIYAASASAVFVWSMGITQHRDAVDGVAARAHRYPRSMPAPLEPTVGWGVLHLFCKTGPLADADAVASAVKGAEADSVQVVPAAMLGHKADLAFMALGSNLWRLRQLQTDLADAGLDVVDSYVSLTELSEYAQGVPDEMKQARLNPNLPPEGKAAFCFYPMSKRRGDVSNWFTLPYDERKELMYAHGASGRKFAGRVLQVITGSTGLDDFEWGVTLFAVHPDDLKEVVYTMRFDEASAIYAEFGPFYTGMVAPLAEVLAAVGLG